MKKYCCSDCGIDTRKNKKDYYIVTDELWDEFGVGKEWLCITCFENRLGRKLQADDIVPSLLTLKVNPYTGNILFNIQLNQDSS